jgi:hypothetical protein
VACERARYERFGDDAAEAAAKPAKPLRGVET